VDQGAQGLLRGAVLHPGAADHRHRARLRPHHLRHRRRQHRLVRHRDALLRDAQGAPGPAEQARRARRHRSPTRSPPTAPTWPRACPGAPMGQRAQQGALRVPLGGPVQPVAGPGPAREFHDQTMPHGGTRSRTSAPCAAPLLLDEDHPRAPRPSAVAAARSTCRSPRADAGSDALKLGATRRSWAPIIGANVRGHLPLRVRDPQPLGR
jgi:hypothetical protein